MLQSLKRLVLQGADATGVVARFRNTRWRSERLLILCYHGISMDDEHCWNPALYMSPDRFRDRMTQLREGGYNVLPFAEAVRRLYDGTLPARAVAITFDDGAYDFVARALPILAEFRFPATVYLATYYCQLQRPVFDTTFAYILWKAGAAELDMADLGADGGRLSVGGHSERDAVMLRVRAHAADRGLTGEQKDSMLRILAERLGVDYRSLTERRILHLMSPDEVSALPSDLVDVQLHTHRHRVPRREGLFRQEIRDNRDAIAALRQDAPVAVHFCYPSGYHEPRFLPWLQDENVMTATTCIPGIASPVDNPLLLPRFVDTMNVSAIEFNAWIAGAGAWLPRRAVEASPGS